MVTPLREADEDAAIAGVVAGAKKTGIVELLELPRPESGQPCPMCEGARHAEPMKGLEIVCLLSRGRGWVVASKPKRHCTGQVSRASIPPSFWGKERAHNANTEGCDGNLRRDSGTGCFMRRFAPRQGGGRERARRNNFVGADVVCLDCDGDQMSVARQNHVAASLQNGSVLVAGGHPGNNVPTSSAEIYSSATGTWTTVGSMGTPRRLFGACTLASGKVLVAGGNSGSGDVASAELFDPAANTWSATGSLRGRTRRLLDDVLFSDGRVLVAGGSNSSGILEQRRRCGQPHLSARGAAPAR